MLYFTADLHLEHAALITKMGRKGFTDPEEHDRVLLDNINLKVEAKDRLVIVGDFCWKRPGYWRIQIKCKDVTFLLGNHDNKQRSKNVFGNLIEIKSFKLFNGATAICCHYPFAFWDRSHHGSYHLYGHCVDMETEILTTDGWKTRATLNIGQEIISYNLEKDVYELDNVLATVDKNYTGDVYTFNGQSVNFRISDEHEIVYKLHSKSQNIFIKGSIKDIEKRNNLVLVQTRELIDSSFQTLSLTEDQLKLYVIIAADGNITPANLVRIRVMKEHKKNYIKSLLKALGIHYKLFNKKNNYVSFHFKLPEYLLNINIKGLDETLFRANKTQADAIFNAYCNSDGHKAKNSLIIYSAKEREIDILQVLFCLNGYVTTKHSRYHGFGTNLQHQLCVTKGDNKNYTNFSKRLCKEHVKNEHFWCVQTTNKTWISRRKGKVHVTGNCHNNREKFLDNMFPDRRSMDIGIDSAINLLGRAEPFSEVEIIEILKDRKGHDPVEYYRRLREEVL